MKGEVPVFLKKELKRLTKFQNKKEPKDVISK